MVDFDTLEAGRETNDLVAVRVMGWEVLHVGYIGMEDESERQRELADWLDTLNVCTVGDYYIDVSKNFIVHVEDWQPSTDIKAAMEVVTKIQRKRGWRFDLLGHEKGYWHAEFFGHPDPTKNHGQRHGSRYATTAELAICAAALEAVQNTTDSGAMNNGDSNE